MTPSDLLEQARNAMAQAYCPYSNFAVGAALLCDDGTVVTGCNVENASYGVTLCAERNALAAAVAAGHRKFTALAIVASPSRDSSFGTHHSAAPYPCGACLQALAEFCDDLSFYLANDGDLERSTTCRLGELLPHRFGSPGAGDNE